MLVGVDYINIKGLSLDRMICRGLALFLLLIIFCIFSRRLSNCFFKGLDEIRIVSKADLFPCALDRIAFAEQDASFTYTVVCDIGTHAEAGQGFKMPAEIVFADKELLTQFLQTDFFHIVIMDIIKNRFDGAVLIFQRQSCNRLPLSD